MEVISASCKEVSLRYETEVVSVRQQADIFVCELQREIQQRKVLQKGYDKLQEAHSLNQDRVSTQLQEERELEAIRSSHPQLN